MSKGTLLVILASLCLLLVNAQLLDFEKEVQRAVEAEETVRLAIAQKLPPTPEAVQDGAFVLSTFQEGLRICQDQWLRTTRDASRYANCISFYQGLAMASIGELAGQHWAKSGASRPTLFW